MGLRGPNLHPRALHLLAKSPQCAYRIEGLLGLKSSLEVLEELKFTAVANCRILLLKLLM
jgi:hypothetical protein